MSEKYDSTEDTQNHISEVRDRLEAFRAELATRMIGHDLSKLESPEKEVFDEFTPKLKGSTYGSEEYKGFLAAMGEALKHHYSHNSHHPEHYENGIRGMDLFDLVEMFCDWKAATMRHANGNLKTSIEHNQGRFDLGEQLTAILENTRERLEW